MNEIETSKLFKERNFRATPQRIAIYKYLCENRSHPDADEIYRSVVQIHPSFSKTTVYNALQALENEGLVIKINIDENRVRYDAFTELHGHFMCKKCNKIYDFEVQKIIANIDERFDINEKNVYYTGVCPECK